MKRRVCLALLGLCLAAGGVLAASGIAGTAPLADTTSTSTETSTTATTTTPTSTTATTTTTVATTTTATTVTTPKPKPKPKPHPKPRPAPTIPAGVVVGNIHVGGLAPSMAYAVVRSAYAAPVVIVLPNRKLRVAPIDLGAVAYIQAAISRALHARPGSRVPVKVVVHEDVTRVWLTDFAGRFDQQGADARVFLRGLKPVVAKSQTGRLLDRKAALRALVDELVAGRRTPVKLPFTVITPKVKDDAFSSIIVIRRGSNHLYLYNGEKPVRDFGVATGQAIYPTPLGRTQIVVKWANPWWYPPASPWAKGLKPIPPGPGNPLGTRWMGLGFSGVGIHGTPDASSIGYSASHGCIRMLIPDAEWLFDHVNIGTPVFIISA